MLKKSGKTVRRLAAAFLLATGIFASNPVTDAAAADTRQVNAPEASLLSYEVSIEEVTGADEAVETEEIRMGARTAEKSQVQAFVFGNMCSAVILMLLSAEALQKQKRQKRKRVRGRGGKS